MYHGRLAQGAHVLLIGIEIVGFLLASRIVVLALIASGGANFILPLLVPAMAWRGLLVFWSMHNSRFLILATSLDLLLALLFPPFGLGGLIMHEPLFLQLYFRPIPTALSAVPVVIAALLYIHAKRAPAARQA